MLQDAEDPERFRMGAPGSAPGSALGELPLGDCPLGVWGKFLLFLKSFMANPSIKDPILLLTATEMINMWIEGDLTQNIPNYYRQSIQDLASEGCNALYGDNVFIQAMADEWDELIRKGISQKREDCWGSKIILNGLDLVVGGGLNPDLWIKMIEHYLCICQPHYVSDCKKCW